MNPLFVTALAAAVIINALGYAGELLSRDLNSMLWFVRMEYVGIANLPALWLSLALFYTNRIRWLKRCCLWLLWIFPLVTLVAVYTNSSHHLFYAATSVSESGLFPTFEFVRGPVRLVARCLHLRNLYRCNPTAGQPAALFTAHLSQTDRPDAGSQPGYHRNDCHSDDIPCPWFRPRHCPIRPDHLLSDHGLGDHSLSIDRD